MIGGIDYRDPITQSLLARARQRQQQPSNPFRLPPRPAPVMGTPPPQRPAEPAAPQYGFQSGYNAAMGTPTLDIRKPQGWTDLYAKLFGKDEDAWSAGGGSAAP